MLSHVTEWVGTVLAAGVIAGLVAVAAGSAGVWSVMPGHRQRITGPPEAG
jgi:hypothetical protein